MCTSCVLQQNSDPECAEDSFQNLVSGRHQFLVSEMRW